MATVEFGIIDNFDRTKRYNIFSDFKEELRRYHCVFYFDEYYDIWAIKTRHIKVHYHWYECDGFGLDMTGINLIPPESIDDFIDIIVDYQNTKTNDDTQIAAVLEIFKKSKTENKWVINYGL